MTEEQRKEVMNFTSQKNALTVTVIFVFLYAVLFVGLTAFNDFIHKSSQCLYLALLAGMVGGGLGIIRNCLIALETRITSIEKILQESK